MSNKNNPRIATVKILLRLLKQQGSLASELTQLNDLPEQDQRFAKELCYGVCRWYFYLDDILQRFVSKPLKTKDNDIKLLLLLGIYQLEFTRVAPHAAINETVNACVFFRKQWAKKLINGVLRSFQRKQVADQENNNAHSPSDQQAHPNWLQQAITTAWPEHASAIFTANNQHPPFTLRVNKAHNHVNDYADILRGAFDTNIHPTPYSDVGLTLDKAVDVKQLPGFNEGWVSVQDEAAQFSASLLQLAPNLRVLDACCAPGGKTCHIGELEPELTQLLALDIEQRRLQRVQENLRRLSINAEVVCADASQPETWWDGQAFDRILLDAPCSATGVIRRHPDIKLLRTPQAIDELAKLQYDLLTALWPLLVEGGILVYATCSVLPQENVQVIEQFMREHSDAQHERIEVDWGLEQRYGRQLLPQLSGHDGFYYARLMKQSVTP